MSSSRPPNLMENVVIKPCPFCGEEEALMVTAERSEFVEGCWVAWVECGHCRARGTSMTEEIMEEAEDEAEEYWNKAKR